MTGKTMKTISIRLTILLLGMVISLTVLGAGMAWGCLPDPGDEIPHTLQGSLNGQSGWTTGPFNITVNDTVYFRIVNDDGSLASNYDYDSIGGVRQQETNAFTFKWDFNYPSSWTSGGSTANKQFSSTGSFQVAAWIDDNGPFPPYYNESAVVTNQITVNVYDPPDWDIGTEGITIPGNGTITSPINGNGYACNSEVTCSIPAAADKDHRYAPLESPTDTYPDDTFNKTDAYTWWCSAGSFKNGNTGRTVIWIAPSTPASNVTIRCTIKDDAGIPLGETGTRDDVNLVKEITLKVYKIACTLVKATSDVNIYWPNDPHYSDKVWGADLATFENNGTIVEDWLRLRIADIFHSEPQEQQHYKLDLELHRYPPCTTDQNPVTTIVYLASSQDIAGWNPYIWINDRNNVGKRASKLEMTFKVNDIVCNSQTTPDGSEYFIDYAIFATPKCPAAEFTVAHLNDACDWGEEQASETDIAHKVLLNVNGAVTSGCICNDTWRPDYFEYIWKGARGPYGGGHSDGMCCCRALGMIEVLQVLGFDYVQDFVNELAEPNVSAARPADQHCNSIWHGLGGADFMRAAWGGGIWNNWQGVCKKGDGLTCYSPQGPHESFYETMNDAPNYPNFGPGGILYAFTQYAWIDDPSNPSYCEHLPTPP